MGSIYSADLTPQRTILIVCPIGFLSLSSTPPYIKCIIYIYISTAPPPLCTWSPQIAEVVMSPTSSMQIRGDKGSEVPVWTGASQ